MERQSHIFFWNANVSNSISDISKYLEISEII